jgi:DNA segregation ATPase FtsK/SpoIIIE-like protein
MGYARSARIIDRMEEECIIGPAEGSKPREILVDPKAYLKKLEAERDPRYDEAVTAILESSQASAAFLEKTLKMGFDRAARIIDQMEADGLIGPFEGPKARTIPADRKTFLKKVRGKATQPRAKGPAKRMRGADKKSGTES